MVGKVCFREKFHKSMALSLEQSPHKDWEMGMNVGGVNQEGDKYNADSLGGGALLKRCQHFPNFCEGPKREPLRRVVNWVGG